jgi:hypothetical protein
MQGRKCWPFAVFFISLTACSGKSLLQADCHSCTTQEQRWEDFAFPALTGSWQGSVETVRNKGAEKKKEEKRAEFRFVDATAFLAAKKITECAALPARAVVLNGVLWEFGSGSQDFEAFAEAEEGRVAYGRLSISADGCRFRPLGRIMGKNRLALPAVQFSQREAGGGRAPASAGADDSEIGVEFLRFEPVEARATGFEANGRAPASSKLKERPALLIRVYKTPSRIAGKSVGSDLAGAEESIYRLWKVN